MSGQEAFSSKRSLGRDLLSAAGLNLPGKTYDRMMHEGSIRRRNGTARFIIRKTPDGQTELIDKTLVEEGY